MRSLRVLSVAVLALGLAAASSACSKAPSEPGAETPDHPIFSETSWVLVNTQTGDVIGRPSNPENPEVVIKTYIQEADLYVKKEYSIFHQDALRKLAVYNQETRQPEHIWLQVEKNGHWYTFELGEEKGLYMCDSRAETDPKTAAVSVVTDCKDSEGKEVFRHSVSPKS